MAAQIGKTGAFIGTIEVLRHRLAPDPQPLGEPDSEDDDDGDDLGKVDGEAYPEYAKLQEVWFAHNKTTPQNGKYGDPAVDALWKYYMDGGKGGEALPDELRNAGRGSTAGNATAADDPMDVDAPDSEGAAQSEKPAASVPTSSMNGRYLTMAASAAQKEGKWESRQMIDAGGAIGTLHITQRSWSEDWEQSESPELKYVDSEDFEGERILFPILMPSSGRPQHALLDLSKQLLKRYVQIVCVKSNELDAYKSHWPELSFFELPSSATELGIGASRHWIMRLAKLICAPDFPFCFMLDDNVEAWKGIRIGDADPVFEQLFKQYPFEENKNGETGKKKDIQLETVLSHFQHDEFRTDLAKFGLIGFGRIGKFQSAKFPFARRHVYKAIIVNLDVLRAANYKERMHASEDLEFNLRISGGVRKISLHNPLEYGGTTWLREAEALDQEDGGAWMKDLIPTGPAVICKCYRFGFHQRKLPSGGASGTVAKKKIDPLPPPPLSPFIWLDWLQNPSNVKWSGKTTTRDIEAIASKLDENDVELEHLVNLPSIEIIPFLRDSLHISNGGQQLSLRDAIEQAGGSGVQA